MIVVIADDITGAAELGGIGLRYGLKVFLSAEVTVSSNADLLVIYTNTRSLTVTDAVQIMRRLAGEVKALSPSLFYKKTDSVLRGHVLAELEAQMEVLGVKKALLVPANPSLGRTIKNGQYFVNGQPVHQAGFSSDPEFPINSSCVKEMVGSQNIHVLAIPDEIKDGISVGEAETTKDLEHWTSQKGESVLLAGAASFFAALLEKEYKPLHAASTNMLAFPLLLVSGTTYPESLAQRRLFPHLVSYMPSSLLGPASSDEKLVETWAKSVNSILQTHGKAIIAVGENITKGADPAVLRERLGAVTARVLQQTAVKELLVEGGSTAFAVIEMLGIRSFTPCEELQQGVVRMKAEEKDALHLTIKPGSYPWPKEWDLTT